MRRGAASCKTEGSLRECAGGRESGRWRNLSCRSLAWNGLLVRCQVRVGDHLDVQVPCETYATIPTYTLRSVPHGVYMRTPYYAVPGLSHAGGNQLILECLRACDCVASWASRVSDRGGSVRQQEQPPCFSYYANCRRRLHPCISIFTRPPFTKVCPLPGSFASQQQR